MLIESKSEVSSAGACAAMTLQVNSKAIHFHLECMTSLIERMAANSESSKNWCISLVSAIIVVGLEAKNTRLVWLSMLPVLMFFVLDVYYLCLERAFRASFSAFVKKLHANSLKQEDLFLFDRGDISSQISSALTSLSIWPFYGLLTGSIILVSLFFNTR